MVGRSDDHVKIECHQGRMLVFHFPSVFGSNLVQDQYGHLLDCIGFQYDPADGYAVTQLRTLALLQAAMAGEPRTMKLLHEWFEVFVRDPEGSTLEAGALSAVLYSVSYLNLVTDVDCLLTGAIGC